MHFERFAGACREPNGVFGENGTKTTAILITLIA
jgi:hypothetical protein